SQGSLHGRFYMFFAGFLVNADNLRRLRRIERVDLLRRAHPVAAQDQVVFATQLATNAVEGRSHFPADVAAAEVSCRLISKKSARSMRGGVYRCSQGCH